jgi:hypothetical protein
MEKQDKGLKLNSLEEIIEYMRNKDMLLIRNVGGKTPKNWIENYSVMNNGEPERIQISEELFFECFKDVSFYSSPVVSQKKNEYHYICRDSFDEDI